METSNTNSMLVKKIQTLDEHNDTIKKDFTELQEKYSEKMREKAKLQDLYNSLKRKYDQVFREGLRVRYNSSPDCNRNVC